MLAKPEARIDYPHEAAPGPGKAIKISDGLYWARLPLPFRLNHVNIWLLEEGNGWAVVDSGCDTAEIRAQWEALLRGPLDGKPLRRHIATHGHTDHIGLSGWLTDRFDMPFVSTLTEWLSPQIRQLEGQGPMRPWAEDYLARLGCSETMIERLRDDRQWHNLIHPMPSCFERVRDGDQIAFGGRKWRVITAGGHAAEHASFYCEEESILIAGDQILPTISPMIGVWSEQPDANPLAEYLASLARFEKLLPPDTLVLPGHGLPFTGLHLRLDQLVEHHGQRLAYLEQQMGAAGTGMELAGALFKKAVNEGHARLALAETVAHLNLLIAQGRAERLEHHDGVWRYQRAQAVTHKSKPARAGKAKVAARAR